MRTLVIAAHPDDEVIGVGGLILKRVANQGEVYVLILCDCLAPRNDREMILNVRGIAKQVSKALGVKQLYHIGLGTDDNKRLDELPFKLVIGEIEKVVEEVDPDEVFTHHHGDWNTDHRIVFQATVLATRTFKQHTIRRLATYETLSATEQAPSLAHYAFQPNLYVDIADVLKRKSEILSLYKSELFVFPHPRSLEAIELNAKLWGSKVGLRAVEAFQMIREVER